MGAPQVPVLGHRAPTDDCQPTSPNNVSVLSQHSAAEDSPVCSVISNCTGRNNEAVARWVFDIATERSDADFDLVDIAEYSLPSL
jgi:hypothetical protein